MKTTEHTLSKDYLNIKECAKLVGKSEHTIRKLITNKKLPIKRIKGKRNYEIRVSKTLLQAHYGIISNDENITNNIIRNNGQESFLKIISVLQEQLQTKDKQIEELNKTINQLVERDRETNILLKNFQEKTFLLESSEQKNISQKTTTKPKEKKKDFLSMLFGW